MAIKILSDIVTVVSEHIANPSTSEYDIFVGLEHYDAGEPVITRYGSTAQLESSVKHFNEGDILVARRNVYLKRAGVVKFEGVTSGDSIVLRVKDERYKAIIPFLLNTEEFWDYAEQNSDGTMSKRLAPDVLLEYECDIPDNHKEIADKLWAAYELKEAYKKMIAATDEMVKSQFIEMFGNPVANNKGWSTMAIKQVAPEEPSRERQTGTVWILNLDMIQSHTGKIIDKVYDEDTNLLSVAPFDEGNVLYSKLRPYLNKVVIPKGKGYATTELVPLRPNQEYLNLTFFSYLLRGDDFVTYANTISSGTKMPRIPLNDLRNFQCILPPMEEQLKFEKVAEQADKSKFELRQAIEKIDKVMKSLLQ